MRQLILIIVALMFCSLQALPQAQDPGQLKGYVISKDLQQPLEGASVTLLKAADSAKIAAVFTDQTGFFLLSGLKEGNYLLRITYIGYSSVFRTINITAENMQVNLEAINIQRTHLTLKAVEVAAPRAPVLIRKDTIEFAADYFRTRENALMEELLKKLPGVQINKEGQLVANGVVVTKLLINGVPYFGGDPALAMRNLSADIIDKIQLYDLKAAPTKVRLNDNGSMERAINITIKKEKMGSFLGRATAGYGTGSHFALNGNLNKFTDKQQLSILGKGDNVNGYQEAGAGGSQGWGGSITRAWNGGINYNNISERLKIGGSYIINNRHVNDVRSSARQNLVLDSTYYYDQSAVNNINSTDHTLNMQLEYSIDTLHFLSLSTNMTYAINKNQLENSYNSLDNKRQPINTGSLRNNDESTVPGLMAVGSFVKRFKKKGRMLTTDLRLIFSSNDQNTFNRSNTLFLPPGGIPEQDTVDQYNKMKGTYRFATYSFVYVEPLFKEHVLQFAYLYTRNYTISGKNTYDYNSAKEAYDHLNDSLSNDFSNINRLHYASLNFQAQKKQYEYSIGISFQSSGVDNYNISRQSRMQLSSSNFFPVASFNYNFPDNSRLQFAYSAGASLPNIASLQPVLDNSDPLYIHLGNPQLKPTFSHNMGMEYMKFNKRNMYSLTANIRGELIRNKVINASWLDSIGRQVSQPVNANGAYNIRASIANSLPLTQQFRVNTNTYLLLNHDISYTNGAFNSVDNLNIQQELGLNCTVKNWLDLTTRGSIAYTGARYKLQNAGNTNNYYNYTFSFDGSLHFPYAFEMAMSLNYLANTGGGAGYNNSAAIFNVALAKSFLSQKKALVKLQAFDLFNQNLAIKRNVGENYIEDVASRVLQRYFMLSISYFLK